MIIQQINRIQRPEKPHSINRLLYFYSLSFSEQSRAGFLVFTGSIKAFASQLIVNPLIRPHLTFYHVHHKPPTHKLLNAKCIIIHRKDYLNPDFSNKLLPILRHFIFTVEPILFSLRVKASKNRDFRGRARIYDWKLKVKFDKFSVNVLF